MNKRAQIPADDVYEQFALPDGTLIVHQNETETDALYREIFMEERYLKHGITLTEANCVFDIGANIGLFSLHASRLAPSATIFALEPVPRIYEALRLNKRLCRIGNLLALPYGLGGSADYVNFAYYPQQSVSSHTTAGEPIEETPSCKEVLCKLRTLSEVIREYRVDRIDLLKLHAAQSELDILAGILPADWPKIRQLTAQVHERCGGPHRMRGLLERQGFRVATEARRSCAGDDVCMVYATR